MKAETTTLLKAIEQILPIDAEAWNEAWSRRFEMQIQQTRQKTSSYRQS